MYQVFVEYDGVADESPLFIGTEMSCKLFLREFWRRYNKGKQSLMLVGPSGRALSFIL
jgi:hypothetical protein